MTTFLLPDLGEGLPDAEIVTWHVKEGDSVKVDQLMVSVETAKAIVEVPSPYEGVITRLHAAAGDVVRTREPLVDFRLTGASAAAASTLAAAAMESPAPQSGTVVGMMPVTGVTLPFVSYGGSSMVVCWLGLGICASVCAVDREV